VGKQPEVIFGVCKCLQGVKGVDAEGSLRESLIKCSSCEKT
jgi:hypothetical protein